MSTRLMERIQARQTFRGATPLANPECPIEQRVHTDDVHVRADLLREAWLLHPPAGEGAMAVPEPAGLRVLARRQARGSRIRDDRGSFELEAEAPLANLLRYADWLDDLAEGGAELSIWLSRYLPIVVDEGPEAAWRGPDRAGCR